MSNSIIPKSLIMFSTWILSDACYSILYYLNDPKETWLRHHSIRILRGALAIGIIIIGFIC